MSFTISYNIKAIDQYSDIAEKVEKHTLKIESAISKVNIAVDKSSRIKTKSASASKKLNDANISANKHAADMLRLDKRIERQQKAKERVTSRLTNQKKKLAHTITMLEIKAREKNIRTQIKEIRTQKKLVIQKEKEAKASARKFRQTMSNVGGRTEQVGHAMATRVVAPIALVGVASAKMAMDFETSMVEVQKVTDKTMAQKIRGSVRAMTKDIPMAHTELANLAADAARFGIEGADNIDSFSRAVAKMAIATDLNIEQAGTALAKIEKQMQIPAAETENLGSAINTLSNNYATSAAEIVTAMQRSSAASANFGLTAPELAGMAAVMNEMSEGAERAGTRMRTLLLEMGRPKKVAKYAEALNMTSVEFKAFKKNAPKELIMTLAKTMVRGGDAADRLADATGMEAAQALLALGSNAARATKAIELSNSEYKKGTSLNKEFEDASETNAMKMQLLRNRFVDVAIVLGDRLLPVVERLTNKYIVPLLNKLDKMDDAAWDNVISTGEFIVKLTLATIAIGNIMTVSAGMSTFFTDLPAVMGGGTVAVGKLGKAMEAIGPLAMAFGVGFGLGEALNTFIIDPMVNAADKLENTVGNMLYRLDFEIDKLDRKELEVEEKKLRSKLDDMKGLGSTVGSWLSGDFGAGYREKQNALGERLGDVQGRIAHMKKLEDPTSALSMELAPMIERAQEDQDMRDLMGADRGGAPMFPNMEPQVMKLLIDVTAKDGAQAEVKTEDTKLAQLEVGKNTRNK